MDFHCHVAVGGCPRDGLSATPPPHFLGACLDPHCPLQAFQWLPSSPPCTLPNLAAHHWATLLFSKTAFPHHCPSLSITHPLAEPNLREPA